MDRRRWLEKGLELTAKALSVLTFERKHHADHEFHISFVRGVCDAIYFKSYRNVASSRSQVKNRID